MTTNHTLGLVRVPVRFYDDHAERDLPTPVQVKGGRTSVWVALDDPALGELLNDAEYYSGSGGPDMAPPGVTMSARATVRAILAAKAKGE